ncbi:MAG: hypothetical protein K0S70_4948 [Microbacterium sp.]|nr:hypothetical protein [Microbacterium sp.]
MLVTATAQAMSFTSRGSMRAPSIEPLRGFSASVSWSKMSFTP